MQINVEEIVSRVIERLLAETGSVASEFDGSIPVEMSARHVHLSREQIGRAHV